MKAPLLLTVRLTLEPLTRENAERLAADLVPVLADPVLFRFTGGMPPTEPDLVERHRRWAPGVSPDGRDWWLNWVVRRADDGVALGTVQATVPRAETAGGRAGSPAGAGNVPDTSQGGPAAVAWVVGRTFQGRGYAVEAAASVLGWLRGEGVAAVTAWIHPDNVASQAVAARLGMRRTGLVVDGEDGWSARSDPEAG